MVPATARKYSLSPGDLTSCWRGVYYKRNNFPKPDMDPRLLETLELFRKLGETGSRFQRELTAEWKHRNVLLESESWLPDNQWNIRGKFDAICTVDGRPTVVEIKGASDQFFEWYRTHNQPLPSHRLQALTYYLIMRAKYPDLGVKVVYVNRKTKKPLVLDAQYSEDDLRGLVENVEGVYAYLEKSELPPVAESIEPGFVSGESTVAMNAMTCRYHTLCTGDANWYSKALTQIGE